MKILFQFDTILSADSIEWCPVKDYRQYVICGTYQLEKETRIGRIYLFKNSNNTLVEQLSKDTSSGIFDLKWNHHKPIIAQATADGKLTLLNIELEIITFIKQENVMNLSLDWNNIGKQQQATQIGVSHNNGYLSVINITDSGGLNVLKHWKAHDYEAWIIAYNNHDKNILYSGGDDTLFKIWDVRTFQQTFVSKEHTAGVCSIQSNPINQNLIATGSYDEELRIWDTRKMKTPIRQYSMGGGVWRIKWHESDPSLLVTACMGGGFNIVKDNKGIISTFKHESIAYGVDWCLNNEQKIQKFEHVCGCSFYDHLMSFWRVQIEE